MPKTPATAPNPIPDPFDGEPTVELTPVVSEPIPELQPKPTMKKRVPTIWIGGSTALTLENREPYLKALDELWNSEELLYLLHVDEQGDLLIAANDSALSFFGATDIYATVPRLISNDFGGRDLTSDRISDEFHYTGIFKAFDGTAKPVSETHRRIAPDLWLVTVG